MRTINKFSNILTYRQVVCVNYSTTTVVNILILITTYSYKIKIEMNSNKHNKITILYIHYE